MKTGPSLMSLCCKVPFHLSIVLYSLLALSLQTVYADGPSVPNIQDCGAVDAQSIPAYQLRNIRLKQPMRDPDGIFCSCIITLHLKGSGELILHQYNSERLKESDWDEKDQVDWDYVAGRNVALGWLAGSTNLLLVSWTDVSGSHGTGNYTGQDVVLARVMSGHASIILKTGVLAGATRQHANYGSGVGHHYFSFNPATQTLSNQATFTRELLAEGHGIPPLHCPVKVNEQLTDLPEGAKLAEIQETVNYRYQLQGDHITKTNVALYYKTQSRDTLADIAKFYLGPLAPPTAISEANPPFRNKWRPNPTSDSPPRPYHPAPSSEFPFQRNGFCRSIDRTPLALRWTLRGTRSQSGG